MWTISNPNDPSLPAGDYILAPDFSTLIASDGGVYQLSNHPKLLEVLKEFVDQSKDRRIHIR